MGLTFGLSATGARADSHDSDDYPTLGPLLTQVVEQELSSVVAASIGGQEPVGDLLPVYVSVDTAERLAEVTSYIEATGGKAGTIFVGKPSDVHGGALSAAVPSTLLPSLAVQPGVAYVQLRVPPRAAQAPSPPSPAFLNGPADVTGATAWHNAGFTGEAVRVGVIDDGFSGFTGRIAARLQTRPQWRCTDRSGVTTSNFSACQEWLTGDHGTDVVDSLLNTAPDVSLYLANWCCSDERDLIAEAIAWMLDNDVQVINHSGSYLWQGPGDGTSPWSYSRVRHVDWAVNNGVLWVNAAGNANGYTWFSDSPVYQDVTVDSSTLKLIDFSLPGDQQADTCLDVRVSTYVQPLFQLRWDDSWPGAEDDLDLHLYTGTVAAGTPLSSQKVQDGGDGSYPLELLSPRACSH